MPHQWPCAHAIHHLHENEQLLLPFSAKEWKSWKIGTQGKRPGFTMVEYVPKAQTVEDWDRMLTVQIFHNSSIPLPQFMGRMKTTFEAKQPCEQTKLQAAAARRSTVTRPVFTG